MTGVSFAPEHDWSAATRLLFPVLRPAGTRGTALDQRGELVLHRQPDALEVDAEDARLDRALDHHLRRLESAPRSLWRVFVRIAAMAGPGAVYGRNCIDYFLKGLC